MLTADCANCFGLCCVVPAFAVSSEFAIDKPAGQPCPNLQQDSRCGVHSQLRANGFSGCAGYDCFGAGQHVSQVVFGGRDWRSAPENAREMFAVFPVVRALHELLYYLDCAIQAGPDDGLRGRLVAAFDGLERRTSGAVDALLALDVDALRGEVNALLLQASESVRAGQPARAVDHRGADLIGAQLRDRDLRGASLRGAKLIGADLGGADLRRADVIGADLRGANLRGADLRGALFLTQSQLDAADGDGRTRFGDAFRRPAHWPD